MYPLVTNAFSHFWEKHPALLYGSSFLLGCYIALGWHWWLMFPLALLFLPLLLTKDQAFRTRLGMALAVIVASIAYFQTTILFPIMPEAKALQGTAIVDINNLSSITKHYGKRWLYQGTIKSFVPEGTSTPIARNITVTINIAQELSRPPANVQYAIKGTLRETAPQRYALQPQKHEPWLAMPGTWSMAEFRYNAKQLVSGYLKSHIADERSAAFLAGIATGDFQDRLMTFEFSRFGLQHIMAISGFHFAIVAGILSLLLRFFLPKKVATIILIAMLCTYFVFLGCGPSIMRAWIAVMIALLSYLLERKSLGLNSLGLGLLVILIYDPLLCNHIGFQFSFITTASILLLFNSSDFLMQKLYQKRPLNETIRMNGLNQHGYFALSCFRQALALTIAVNLVAMPTTLYYFLKFPWLSLAYNLFFPFLVSISMLLLILGTISSLTIPYIGTFLHEINTAYTRFMLDYTYNIPISLDIEWRISAFPQSLLIGYLCLVFLGGILIKHHLDTRKQDHEDLAFV